MSTMFLLFDNDFRDGDPSRVSDLLAAMIHRGDKGRDVVVFLGAKGRPAPFALMAERRLRTGGWRVERAAMARPVWLEGLTAALTPLIGRWRPRRIVALDPGAGWMKTGLEKLAPKFWRPVDMLDPKTLLEPEPEAA